jgi:transmembrane sensor
VAAGVCLAALAGGTAMWRRHATSRDLAGPVRLGAPTARTEGGALYVTAPGQRAEVLLRDGTQVRLAPASRLRVATDYGTGRRDVYLDGEAYFDVTHDEHRPFTVFTANASAQDLGTQFSVRSYPGEGAVEVVVREGAVALSGVGPLEAGDVGRLTAKGRTDVRRGVDADSALGWLDGRLDFHDAPLAHVLRDVGRWYDVDVSAEPALAALPFTGTLAGGSADAAVELVAATLGLLVHHDGPRHVLRRELAPTLRDTAATPRTTP